MKESLKKLGGSLFQSAIVYPLSVSVIQIILSRMWSLWKKHGRYFFKAGGVYKIRPVPVHVPELTSVDFKFINEFVSSSCEIYKGDIFDRVRSNLEKKTDIFEGNWIHQTEFLAQGRWPRNHWAEIPFVVLDVLSVSDIEIEATTGFPIRAKLGFVFLKILTCEGQTKTIFIREFFFCPSVIFESIHLPEEKACQVMIQNLKSSSTPPA